MRPKSYRPTNKLLAKLPRSSSGSRELSASSSAARLPSDIFEVSMTDGATGSFALVSFEICSGGASSGDFIKPCAGLRVLPQQIARRKLVVGLGEAVHLRDQFF